ncbi:MAG: hypothetical protein WCF19_02885 [Chlamydiales bacterium]
MKITSRILSIPPYLSTTWKNISSLYVNAEEDRLTLVVRLQNQIQVEVPGLSKELIHEIFEAHSKSAEEETEWKNPLEGPFSFTVPVKSDGSFDPLVTSMQHNPEQADLAPIPPDVLKRLTMIARVFGLEDTSTLPKPEPGCHCVYCQITRAFAGGDAAPIEEITHEDLTFRDWEIQEAGHQLYNVTNPLDANERYSVFLGTPLGCTCGSKNCEHIRAVLQT